MKYVWNKMQNMAYGYLFYIQNIQAECEPESEIFHETPSIGFSREKWSLMTIAGGINCSPKVTLGVVSKAIFLLDLVHFDCPLCPQ